MSPRVLIGIAAVLATACGLLAPPGGYTSEGDADGGVAVIVTGSDAAAAPDVVVLPDGNVVPASAGTIVVAAGEHDPTSPDDNPAWSADVWSGLLDGSGIVTSWRVEKSAPIVGPFDSAAVVSGNWLLLSFGLGIGGGRGTALQTIGWAPGPTGEWHADGANMPGGLDELSRAFFGAHVITVGGIRYTQVDGGTFGTFTTEVHTASVDVAQGTLGNFGDSGFDLVTARSRAGIGVVGDDVYVAGGRDGSGAMAAVEAAKLDPSSGAVAAAFAAQPAMKSAGQDHKILEPSMTGGEGYLFVAGGHTSANAPVDVVLSSKIAADGSLGAFQNVTKLPKPLRDFGFVAHKGVLYVLGGQGASSRSSDVYSARIAGDGTLGAWESTNAALPGKRSNVMAVAY